METAGAARGGKRGTCSSYASQVGVSNARQRALEHVQSYWNKGRWAPPSEGWVEG